MWLGLLPSFLLLLCAMADPPPLVDTRLLGRPKSYSGHRGEWQTWKYVFKSYVGAMDSKLLDFLDGAEGATAPIVYGTLSDDAKTAARTVAFVLSQLMQGATLQIVMNTPSYNGFEAWRLITKQEEPTSGASQVNLLSSIMATRFSGNLEKFIEEAQRLEGQFQMYERMHMEVIPDTLKQAILKSQAPSAIKSQIDLQTYVSAESLRDTMVGYVQLQLSAMPATSSSSQGPQPMDIGAVWKGKSSGKGGHDTKGKSKVKGKDKQKGKDQKGGKSDGKKKTGDCHNCGKPGYARDCWSKPARNVNEVTQKEGEQG